MQMSLKSAIKRALAGARVPEPMLTLVDNVMMDYIDWPKNKATRKRRRRNKLARKSRRKNRVRRS